MTKQEMDQLIAAYFDKEDYKIPGGFEHRVDPLSTKMIYSLVRSRKPTVCLEIGSWYGGSTITIMAALMRNKKKFYFYSSELKDDMRRDTQMHCMQVNGQSPVMVEDITKNLDLVPEKLDFLFVDTNHDAETAEWIIQNIFPKLKLKSLLIFHDWAIEDVEGKWIGKGEGGKGALPETQVYMGMHDENRWPYKKIFWTYKNPGSEETAFFEV